MYPPDNFLFPNALCTYVAFVMSEVTRLYAMYMYVTKPKGAYLIR